MEMTDQAPVPHISGPSICLLVPYFGKWPFWFPFFLKSCAYNPTITWHLHTDCGVPDDLPPNVKIFVCSFTDYCQRISKALGISFAPERSYKLCDMRPTMGLIHQDELRGFDFWGYSDIDLIYGDLRKYFTAERLAKRDIFSTHRRRIAGHLCLIRNNQAMCEAFMSVPNWQSLLSDPNHVTFDESGFSRLFVRHKNWPDWLADLAKPLNKWTRRTENVEAFSTPNASLRWIDGSLDFPGAWFWDHGRLTNDIDKVGDKVGNKAREFPYLHFMTWKQKEWPAQSLGWSAEMARVLSSNRWRVSSRGFEALELDATTRIHS